MMLRESVERWIASLVTGTVTLRLRRGDDWTILDTTAPNLSYAPEKLSMERVGDAAFGPTDRIGQLTMRNLDIADSRARLEQYAAMGIVSGPTSELVGSLEAGGAEEMRSRLKEICEQVSAAVQRGVLLLAPVADVLQQQVAEGQGTQCRPAQAGGDLLGIALGQFALHIVGNAALQPVDLRQAAVAGDVGGLARPRRDGAEARQDQEQAAGGLLNRDARAVFQQARQDLFFLGVEGSGDLGEVRKLGIQPGDGGHMLGQQVEQFAVAESGKGGSAAQDQHCRNSLWRREGVGAGRAGPQRPCILP